jgi:hypothetical protein
MTRSNLLDKLRGNSCHGLTMKGTRTRAVRAFFLADRIMDALISLPRTEKPAVRSEMADRPVPQAQSRMVRGLALSIRLLHPGLTGSAICSALEIRS